jgi:hypothetical protein
VLREEMELLLLLIILNYLEEKEVIHMEFFLLLQIQFYIFILEDKGQLRLVLLHPVQMEDIMEEELAVKMEVIILILKLQAEEEEQHILRLLQDY